MGSEAKRSGALEHEDSTPESGKYRTDISYEQADAVAEVVRELRGDGVPVTAETLIARMHVTGRLPRDDKRDERLAG